MGDTTTQASLFAQVGPFDALYNLKTTQPVITRAELARAQLLYARRVPRTAIGRSQTALALATQHNTTTALTRSVHVGPFFVYIK